MHSLITVVVVLLAAELYECQSNPPVLAQEFVAQYQFGVGTPRYANFSGLFAGTIAVNWNTKGVMMYIEDDEQYSVPWQFQTTLISHPNKESPSGVDVYQTFSESRCWYLGEDNIVIEFLIGIPFQIPQYAVFYGNATINGDLVEIWQWDVSEFIGTYNTEMAVRVKDGAVVYYASSPFSYYNTNIQQVNNVNSQWFAKPEGECVNPPLSGMGGLDYVKYVLEKYKSQNLNNW